MNENEIIPPENEDSQPATQNQPSEGKNPSAKRKKRITIIIVVCVVVAVLVFGAIAVWVFVEFWKVILENTIPPIIEALLKGIIEALFGVKP